jgi:hypothetical protein
MYRWTRAEDVVAPKVELVDLDRVDWPSKLKRWS